MSSGRLILQSRQGVVLPSSCFDSVFETIERGDSFWAKQERRSRRRRSKIIYTFVPSFRILIVYIPLLFNMYA